MNIDEIPDEVLDSIAGDLKVNGLSRERMRELTKQVLEEKGAEVIAGQHSMLDKWDGIQAFMETINQVAEKNLVRDGELRPVLFGIQWREAEKKGQMVTIPVNMFMKNDSMKSALSSMLKKMSAELKLHHIVMVMEAWVKHMDKDDAMWPLLRDGVIKPSQLTTKKEAIVVQSFSKDGPSHCISSIIVRDESGKATGVKEKDNSFKNPDYKTSSRFNPWETQDVIGV